MYKNQRLMLSKVTFVLCVLYKARECKEASEDIFEDFGTKVLLKSTWEVIGRNTQQSSRR